MVKGVRVKPREKMDQFTLDLMDRYGYKKSSIYERLITPKYLPKKNDTPEKIVQKRLHKIVGGEMEVKCAYGRIDILTRTEIIEVKTAKHYKHAYGQVVFYHSVYNDRIKRIHLFDHEELSYTKKRLIVSECSKVGVVVTWDEKEKAN